MKGKRASSMRYAYFVKRAFLKNTIYRFDYILGVINSCLQIFISCEIWRALYNSNSSHQSVAFSAVVTSFIINLGLSNAYSIDDLAVQKKIWDGTIICELLRPVEFRVYLLAESVGNVLFKVIFNYIPSFLIMIFVYRKDFIFCTQPVNLIFFMISICLGFFVLWEISSIIQMLCFWFVNVWSISTIKNVFINILSGTLLPYWFLPHFLRRIVEYTPMNSIYIIPVRIYLGEIANGTIISNLLIQLLWIVILMVVGNMLWLLGKRKLVIQGG